MRQSGLNAANALQSRPLPLPSGSVHRTDQVISRFAEFSNPAIHAALQVPDHHPAVDASRLTHEARLDAHRTIASATPLIATHRMPQEAPAVLALANHFIETGQYVNYVRASQLGRLVISWADQEEVPEDHVEQNIAHAVRRVAWLWRRAPVLVLLVAWMILGIVPIPFNAEMWGVSLLALVGLQFIVTIRNWPRRR